MSSEWQKIKIDEIGDVKSGKRLPLGYSLVEYKTPFPYIRLVDIDNGRVQKGNLQYLTPETREHIKRYVVNTGDVCLAIVGNTIGVVFYIESDLNDINLTENAARITSFKSFVNSKYIYYYLTSPIGQASIQARKVGSAQGKLPLYNIKSLEIEIPSRETQDTIVELLEALDDRITLIRETNATLEAIAQALFKSWFVDFDPVHANAAFLEDGEAPSLPAEIQALFPSRLVESPQGLIPEGWEVCAVEDVIETVGGATPNTKNDEFWNPPEVCWTSPKDLSGANTPVLLDTERKISKQGLAKISSGLLPKGTLIMSSRAPIGYLAIAQIPLAINQGYIAMPPGGKLPPLFMLYWCRQNMEVIKNRANGSTFMEISKKAFRPIEIVLPIACVIDAFMEIAAPLFERLVGNEKQISSLSELRDTLLPRLISGQLRLPEAEAALAEVI